MNKDVMQTEETRQAKNRIARAARCPACQLQLCKAREASPHDGLKEAERTAMQGADRAYTCQTCGITLVNSRDAGKPGWSHAKGI